LKRGDRVEVRGFGVFFVKQRSARMGRKPQNGVPVAVNQKNMPPSKLARKCASGSTMRRTDSWSGAVIFLRHDLRCVVSGRALP